MGSRFGAPNRNAIHGLARSTWLLYFGSEIDSCWGQLLGAEKMSEDGRFFGGVAGMV